MNAGWWLLIGAVLFYLLLFAIAFGHYVAERRAARRFDRDVDAALRVVEEPEPGARWEERKRPTEEEYAEAAVAFKQNFAHGICEGCGAEYIAAKDDLEHRCFFCGHHHIAGAASS